MKFTSARVVAILICAAWGLTAQAQTAATFTLTDQRPPEERIEKNKARSFVATNCNYSILNMADAVYDSDRMAALKSDLTAQMGDSLAGKDIAVTHYGVYYNSHIHSVTRNPFGTGVIGGALTAEALKCPKEKVNGGWYDPSEVTSPTPPIVTEITIRIDGKDYAARAVHSMPPLTKPGRPKAEAQSIMNAEYAKALAEGNAALVAALKVQP